MQRYMQPVSYILIAAFIMLCFQYHLIPMLIGGMVVFMIVKQLDKTLAPRVHTKLASKITLLTVIAITLLIASAMVLGIYQAIQFGSGSNLQNLLQKMFDVMQHVKQYLPEAVIAYLPEDVLALKTHLIDVMRHKGIALVSATGSSANALMHIIMGMILGAVIAFSFLKDDGGIPNTDFIKAIMTRITRFYNVFQSVVVGQVKISGINTILTAIYLLVILPLCGVDLPYAGLMVVLTFILGLIPVAGNIITNVIIVSISLSVSPIVAIFSLIFLVVVHKLEYIVNAKIVGSQLKISIWEMIVLLVLMHIIFGVIGVVIAPVLYGYLKEELREVGML